MSVETVTIEIPRDALTVVEQPITVSQLTSERLFGIPAMAFLKLCKGLAFPFTRIGRLKVALCRDVQAYIEAEREKAKPRTEGGVLRYLQAAGFKKVK